MSGKRIVTLGLVQMACVESAEENLERALGFVSKAATGGANVVILPELFLGPYFCAQKDSRAAFDRAEPIPGRTTEKLGEAAKKHGIVLIGGSLFEKVKNGRFYNTAPVFGPEGTLLGTYRKSHIPHDPGFYEQKYFSPGDTGIRVHDTPFGKICVLICYDQWFPEAARIAALKGAEIIVYPTAIAVSGDIPPVTEGIFEDWEAMWRAVQVGHAAANNVYVAAVNRVGTEGNMHFWGGSFVADPGAMLLAKADDTEQVILATCDLDHVKRTQEAWRFLKERRPDLYGELVNEH